MPTTTTTRPYRLTTRDGEHIASASSYRRAQAAVARRIASDAEGQVLYIEGPAGRTACTNDGLGIRYIGAQA